MMTAQEQAAPRQKPLRLVSLLAKALTLISAGCSFFGVPLAGLIFLAAGMKTVPKLSGDDMFYALPLPVAGVFLGMVGFILQRLGEPGSRFQVFAAVATIIPTVTTAVLLWTYFSYR